MERSTQRCCTSGQLSKQNRPGGTPVPSRSRAKGRTFLPLSEDQATDFRHVEVFLEICQARAKHGEVEFWSAFARSSDYLRMSRRDRAMSAKLRALYKRSPNSNRVRSHFIWLSFRFEFVFVSSNALLVRFQTFEALLFSPPNR